jgi:hypothetical protein
MTAANLPATPVKTSVRRSPGIWMAAFIVVYILFNAVRAALNPVHFAAVFGIPLAGPEHDAFVLVYAIRALFLGLFGLALFVTRNYRTLALFSLVAAVMPIGDAALVAARGGGGLIVGRHIFIAVFLVLTWLLITRRLAKEKTV